MKIENLKIENMEKAILKALYEQGKQSGKEDTYQAESYNLPDILNRLGMTEDAARPALNNLADFDFLKWDQNSVKLLPSAIKYSKNEFEK